MNDGLNRADDKMTHEKAHLQFKSQDLGLCKTLVNKLPEELGEGL